MRLRWDGCARMVSEPESLTNLRRRISYVEMRQVTGTFRTRGFGSGIPVQGPQARGLATGDCVGPVFCLTEKFRLHEDLEDRVALNPIEPP